MAADLWVPLALSDEERANRQNHNREGVARLKREVALVQAQSEMDAISERLAREFPRSDGRWGAVVIPMQETIVGSMAFDFQESGFTNTCTSTKRRRGYDDTLT